MPRFAYKARTRDGQAVEGEIEAPDRAAAILLVEKERRTPISIRPVSGPVAEKEAAPGKPSRPARPGTPEEPVQVRSLSDAHKFLFTEQLAHLLSAGMTLDESLGILKQRLKQPELQGLANSLHRALVDGRSLSAALRDFPKIFTPLYTNMVAAGEASGALSEILRRLVVHLGEVKALRDRVQQALLYPAVLVVAGIGLVLVFMTVMVPQLEGFFTQTGQSLPLPTRILLAANDAITGYWWAALLGGGLLFAAFKQFTRSQEGHRAWDRFRLRIPGYGTITRYRFYAQFARTMGTLIENGLTMLKALELLEEISGNEEIRVRMGETRRAVIDGASLSNALRPHNIFPELFLDMMAVGEQTGRFGETMQMIANVYERELDKQVKIASTLIPPVIMIFIAAIVGLVVLGILSAVFNLTSGLRTRIG